MFIHTLSTWFFANILHPLIMLVCVIIVSNFNFDHINSESLALLVPLMIASLIISIPCFLVAWPLLFLITHVRVSVESRFLLWLFAAPGVVMFEALLMFLLDDSFTLREFEVFIPAMIAVFITVLLHKRAFKRMLEPDVEPNFLEE